MIDRTLHYKAKNAQDTAPSFHRRVGADATVAVARLDAFLNEKIVDAPNNAECGRWWEIKRRAKLYFEDVPDANLAATIDTLLVALKAAA